MFQTLVFEQTYSYAILLPVCAIAIPWTVSRLLGKYGQRQKSAAISHKRFETPLPEPLEHFRLNERIPELYRPFRHGPNHITMGTRKLDWNKWIEMDAYFMYYHGIKVKQLTGHLEDHVKYVDNAVTRDACHEVYEELTRYLTHRYPEIFQLEGNVLRNLAMGEQSTYPADNPTNALASAAKLVQDDLILMVENEDGQYHLDAGAVCLPGFWRLKEKFRMSLDTLHLEAGVPHYAAKLQLSMNRFFKKIEPENPVARNNFFIQLDNGLNWSVRMGDEYGDNVASWASANDTGLKIEDLHFRSERQTLRRLPRSRALLFTVRTYFEPITTIAQEPHVPGRLAEAIRAWDSTVSHYKGKSQWDFLLLPYLDEQHEKQMKSGLLDKVPEGDFPY